MLKCIKKAEQVKVISNSSVILSKCLEIYDLKDVVVFIIMKLLGF